MLKQGDIIKLNLDPTKGHEQSGYRPALVVSNKMYNKMTNLALICPITNTIRNHPLNVLLDSRTQTTGVVLCHQIRVVDFDDRGYTYVETIPQDLLQKVVDIIKAEIDTPNKVRIIQI